MGMWRVLILGLWTAGHAAMAGNWFVSPRGNDAADGGSPDHPWRSLERVNRHIAEHGLLAGDAIQLLGGGVFSGSLTIDRAGGGTDAAPARITTYGSGQAVIRPGVETGILVRETGGITLSHLTLKASGANHGDGIRCDRNEDSDAPVRGIVIQDCFASGFGWHGIMVDAAQHRQGFDGIRIEDCTARGNRYAGIMVYGGNQIGRTQRPHSNVVIARCHALGNPGDPDQLGQHSGSGILVDGVSGGLVRECVSSGNGAECRSDRGGPVGIWAHACRGVVIERCESFGNRSCLRDGGGFDLDAGCEDSILRWNYSHDNHGAGFLVYTYTGAAYVDRGCRVIGNISWNDGAPGSGYAGIQIGTEEGSRIQDLEVSHNTVLAPPRSVAAMRISGHNIEGRIAENRVVAAPHGILVAISGFRHSLHFEGNHYWRPDGKPVFLIDAQWTVPAFGAWHNSTGPETRFRASGEVFEASHLRVTGHVFLGQRDGPRWPVIDPPLKTNAGAPRIPPRS